MSSSPVIPTTRRTFTRARYESAARFRLSEELSANNMNCSTLVSSTRRLSVSSPPRRVSRSSARSPVAVTSPPLPSTPSTTPSPPASECNRHLDLANLAYADLMSNAVYRTFKSIANQTAKSGYRPDLRAAAVARASAIRRSQRPVKPTPEPKLRGNAAKKAAEKA